MAEETVAEENPTEETVAIMSTVEIENIYDVFLKKGIESLINIQQKTQMEHEYLSTASSQVIIGAMTHSLNAYSVLKEGMYIDIKIEVTKESRLDNLLIEAMKSQNQQLATVGAGGLVPSKNDFSAANHLRGQVYKKAQNKSILDDDFKFEIGTGYTKP